MNRLRIGCAVQRVLRLKYKRIQQIFQWYMLESVRTQYACKTGTQIKRIKPGKRVAQKRLYTVMIPL